MQSDETRGLMPHHQPGHGFPISRDWGLDDFDCKATTCIFNRDGKCVIPSRCEIGEDGHCLGYKPKKDGAQPG